MGIIYVDIILYKFVLRGVYMANNCLFDMRITGREEAIKELIAMLKWEGEFKEKGLGRTYSFDADELEETDVVGIYSVTGYGDCAWSILTAMCEEYRKDAPSLESETKRLGLVVEVYSSEPGMCFQEHYLFVKGDVLVNECVDYEEHWVSGYSSLEEYNKEFETDFTEDMLNEDGDVCIGGFGDDYASFEDVTHYFTVKDFLPEKFVFEDLDRNEKEVFHLAAVCKNGDGFYLGDMGSLVRSTDTPFDEPENEFDENGLVVFREFALNGLYFEFEVDGGLSPEATEMLLAESTVIVDSAISDIAKKHLSIDAQIGNANSIKDKQSFDSKDALNNNIEL